VRGIGIDLPSRVDAKQDGREAQEALALRGLRMATANPRERQVHHRASGVADEPQSLGRRETPPRIHLALLDVGRGVGGEDRPLESGRGLRHGAIIERADYKSLRERVGFRPSCSLIMFALATDRAEA